MLLLMKALIKSMTGETEKTKMKLKRSAQLILVGLVGLVGIVGIAKCCNDVSAAFFPVILLHILWVSGNCLRLLCCIPWRICYGMRQRMRAVCALPSVHQRLNQSCNDVSAAFFPVILLHILWVCGNCLRLLCCIPWRICYGMRQRMRAVCALPSSAIAGKLVPSAT